VCSPAPRERIRNTTYRMHAICTAGASCWAKWTATDA
jgi:hypothetical protein